MEIQRNKNDISCYDYELNDGQNRLVILYAGNLDLYMILGTNAELELGKESKVDFQITKEDMRLFRLFDDLYQETIEGKVFLPDKEELLFGSEPTYSKDYRDSYPYSLLVDENTTITWLSDDDPVESADSISISKQDEDTYRLTFTRRENPDFYKNAYSISVRFRNSGSRYDPFNCIFMRMFQKLQDLDPEYHQVDIEEVLYKNKTYQKKRT